MLLFVGMLFWVIGLSVLGLGVKWVILGDLTQIPLIPFGLLFGTIGLWLLLTELDKKFAEWCGRRFGIPVEAILLDFDDNWDYTTNGYPEVLLVVEIYHDGIQHGRFHTNRFNTSKYTLGNPIKCWYYKGNYFINTKSN